MKKLIFITLMLGYLSVSAQGYQSFKERFTLGAYTEPQLYLDDGFNIGTAIEYQGSSMYVKAQTFYYPDLRGITYWDFEGVVGVNYRSVYDDWRSYAGIKLGAINRQGWGHPKYGFEAGVDFYWDNGIFTGLLLSRDWRTDGRVWEASADEYWVWNFGFRIGFYWYWK